MTSAKYLSRLFMQSKPAKRQTGITLIESLIALVVSALGILGIVGVQMRTLADTQTTVRRAQAIRLIDDLGERMRVNPNAMLKLASFPSGYGQKASDITPADCTATACTPSQQITYDLYQWKLTVEQTLPLGQASIFEAPGEAGVDGTNRRVLGVIISWRANEREGLATDDIDASKVRQNDGSFSAGTDTDNACPADRICHLQYLPVPARCAPYDNGAAELTAYCS
ncbi:type IV pilus modification protein PilV [Comamonas sp. NLF-1-9]|uniref:type IV pilus modification protein PilV n=1 Tax=Comamonas sp. NLF-1-9 TaxID=2853163 RepID=UPI0021046A29|nr:type IV pilus modification protein PilV [Comamonas sp. NLF-1-9]